MPPHASFGQSATAKITILIDNRTDLLVRSTETVKYYTDEPLVAEHGFAALVDFPKDAIRILWDSGATRHAVLENMKRMNVNPADISKIAISHGHDDHTSGVTEVLSAMDLKPKPRQWETGTMAEMRRYAEGRRVPVIVHPAAFRERWITPPNAAIFGPLAPPPRDEWQAAGAEIVLSEGPYALAPGCWTTGSIPRTSFETAGVAGSVKYREGDSLLPDAVEDDQAIVVNIKDKGLVILSGCAHAGIVNTVNYARQISGVDQVWAVIGGFHLAKATDAETQQTVDQIKTWHPHIVVPTHCTGFKAMQAFAAEMPDEFAQGLVGATLIF